MSYIGKIAVDTPIDNIVATKTVKVGKKSVAVEFSGPTENIPLFEKVYVFAVYCFEEGEKKAFKVLDESESGSGTLLWVDYKEAESVFILSTENFENSVDKNISLENFFHGVAEAEIIDSFESLEKEYNPSNKHKMYIAFAAFVFIVFASIIVVALNASKPQVIEHPKIEKDIPQKTLSPIEVLQLKQQLSEKLIIKVRSEANDLMNNELLNTKAAIRSIVFSYDLSGGDVSMKGSFGYEYKFPVRGSILTSGTIYTKSIPFVIKSSSDSNSTISHTLTEECVKNSLGILNTPLIKVTERTDNLIKINYKEMRPDVFVGSFENLLNSCPVLVDNVVILDNGMLDVSATLYDKDVL